MLDMWIARFAVLGDPSDMWQPTLGLEGIMQLVFLWRALEKQHKNCPANKEAMILGVEATPFTREIETRHQQLFL